MSGVLRGLVAFVPVAALLTLTPGAATAMVVRNAARGGRRHAFMTTTGNSVGVLAWGCFAAVGIAAVVATSAAAFTAVKVAGAVVLIAMGARSLRGRPSAATPEPRRGRAPVTDRAAVREGVVTSIANPKLAVFFVALFPQFVPAGSATLPATLAMASLIVAFDLIWFSALAVVVTRARRGFVDGPWQRRVERLTGAVLIGIAVRLAFEPR
jgi:threonine/homoserine/homoserine lactone efflux protein